MTACPSLLLLASFLILGRFGQAIVFRPSPELRDGWTPAGRPHPDSTVKIYFALKQTGLDWLRDELQAVSDPRSSRYGQYSNWDRISQFVHGRRESVAAFESALRSVNFYVQPWHYTIGKDFAVVDLPVASAEELFAAQFLAYQSTKDADVRIVKSKEYSVPKSLRSHLDFVFGINEFPRPNKVFVQHRIPSVPQLLGTTPATIDKDYNISGYTSSSSKNSQAIASFLKQYFSPEDLAKFQEKFNLPNKPITKIVGDDKPKDPGIEANLDVQYISATGRNVDTWFVYVNKLANHGQEDFLSWIIGQVNTTDSPWVHSASYGDDESSIAPDYLNRVDNEFMKFGVSGRTVLFATGDSGVECSRAGTFNPNWPTSSPHVTAVGGTISLDTVWDFGGGGFSNVYSMPEYQKDAVEAYLKSGQAPPTKFFNVSGRAYPDVSAYSVGFEIVVDGYTAEVDGTSCSTPTFSGILSLLNDVRLLKGKSTLGFLNPLLYQQIKGQGFFDIQFGNNGAMVCEGFKAIKGWDPASGWGSPNFGLLRYIVDKL